MAKGLHTLEISKRPPKTWAQTLNAIAFSVVFNFGCLMVNLSQFAFLFPLRLLPFPWAQQWYETGIRYSKGAFGTLLVLMCQWLAPTRLVVTFETEGPGAFTEEEVAKVAVRNKSGRVVGLNLPQKLVLIANHQVYVDWWYAWCLTYFMGTHRDVFIVLKKSLKWVPVLGWGMQFFDFIFLARSWAADRLYLVKRLSVLGSHAEKHDEPLTFLLYPEGTLVSNDTRPISKKYADKLGIPDMLHTLLPRSTGLLYSLRALGPRIPNLQLLDITVAYPGIPPMGFGQSWYTLRSVFLDRVPPPAVHMHIRRFDVAKDVPIGDVSKSKPDAIPNSTGLESEVPENERETFDLWLRERWQEKDQFMARFHTTGTLASEKEAAKTIVIPLQIRSQTEILGAFCFFIPAAAGFVYSRLRGLTS
ncbi:acyltransferase-domain-containing protein [Dentipellis sp. KUC8613]|nr:acyltransferase-domain-containing protein [Dentipellis sp. KUC8613]